MICIGREYTRWIADRSARRASSAVPTLGLIRPKLTARRNACQPVAGGSWSFTFSLRRTAALRRPLTSGASR